MLAIPQYNVQMLIETDQLSSWLKANKFGGGGTIIPI